MRSGRLGLAAPQVPEGSPRRGEWRQDRQASDRDYSRSNPTEGRAERPTCGSLHLEVLRRGLPLVCNLFVLDLLALVEGRQTGPLYCRDMDENVLAAALRLNEPITFGRVEPLHDTGRHRTLSPFWTFDDTGAPHRIQDDQRRRKRGRQWSRRFGPYRAPAGANGTHNDLTSLAIFRKTGNSVNAELSSSGRGIAGTFVERPLASCRPEGNWVGQVVAINQGALLAKRLLDLRRGNLSPLGIAGGGDPTTLAGGEGRAHDPKRSAGLLVAIRRAARGEQVWRVDTRHRSKRNLVDPVAAGELELTLVRLRGMPFRAPSAQRNRVVEACAVQHILLDDLTDAVDVTALAGPKGWAGNREVGALATFDRADDLEVGPGLGSAALLGLADAAGIPGVVGLADEVSNHVIREGHARHHRSIFGKRRNTIPTGVVDGRRPGLGAEIGGRLDTPERRAER